MTQTIIVLLLALTYPYTIGLAQSTDSFRSRDSKTKEALALIEFQKRNYKKVIQILEPVNSEISEKSLALLGTTFQKIKKYKRAQKIFISLTHKQPKKYIYYFHVATLSYNIYKKERPKFYAAPPSVKNKKAAALLKDLSKKQQKELETNKIMAIVNLKKTIELNPIFIPAYLHLTKIYKYDENHHERQNLLKEAIKNLGPKPYFVTQLCEVYSVSGFIKDAIETCHKAIKKDPKNAANHLYLLKTLGDRGQVQQATSLLYKTAKKFKNSFEVQNKAGRSYFEERNYKSAIISLKRAIQLRPQKLPPRFNYLTKKEGEAKKDYILAESRSLLAQALFENETYDEALQHFIKSCQTDPRHRSQILTAAIKLDQKEKVSSSKKYRTSLPLCFAKIQ